jgi:hypothetical protein
VFAVLSHPEAERAACATLRRALLALAVLHAINAAPAGLATPSARSPRSVRP